VGVSVGLGRGVSQQILTLTLTDPNPDPKVFNVCVRRESLQVLGVLRATRLVLGVLLDGRRELRGNTEVVHLMSSPCIFGGGSLRGH